MSSWGGGAQRFAECVNRRHASERVAVSESKIDAANCARAKKRTAMRASDRGAQSDLQNTASEQTDFKQTNPGPGRRSGPPGGGGRVPPGEVWHPTGGILVDGKGGGKVHYRLGIPRGSPWCCAGEGSVQIRAFPLVLPQGECWFGAVPRAFPLEFCVGFPCMPPGIPPGGNLAGSAEVGARAPYPSSPRGKPGAFNFPQGEGNLPQVYPRGEDGKVYRSRSPWGKSVTPGFPQGQSNA